MQAAMRKMRMENLRTKIATCQQEWSALARKSFSPDLTLEERITVDSRKDEITRQCDYLRYLLSIYDHDVEAESDALSCLRTSQVV